MRKNLTIKLMEEMAIKQGLADIKAGRVVPHKEAKNLYKKWL